MNIKHISLAFAAAAALLAGCAKSPIETPSDTKGLTDLELTHVGSTEVKSVIDGTDFPTEGEIGLFLFTDEAATTPYGETGYTNAKYAYNSTKGKWTASPSIKVGSTPGYLYGYYPYSSEAESIKTIPVASSLDGYDVMYASKQNSPITDQTASQTAITMNHALARVSITVKNNGYTGNAKLTSIKFAGAKTSETGTLDATTGTISGTTMADVTLDVPTANQTITATGSTYECLLVPSGKDETKQEVTLTLTIDGEPKTAKLSGDNGVIIAKGTKSNITIGLSNSGISVSSVSIDEWKEVEVGGHKVTVKRSSEDGIADDVFLDVTSNGSNVTIKSHCALTGRRTSCTCTPAGKATCTPSTDEATGICTFTITDVQDDITAEVGYLKYNATVEYDSDMGSVKLNGVAVASGSTVQILYGEEAEFAADANTGYGFVMWTDGNDNDLSTDNPFTISSVTSNITLNAVFGYEISAEVTPVGAGTVMGAGIYAKGSTATLTATAGGSFAEFVGWVNKAVPGDTTKTSSIDINVAVAASYVAVFRLKDALSGVFTVAADDQGNPTKKVQFSKGNLYCSGVEFNENGTVKSIANAQWGFEANQYDTTPSSNVSRDPNHISHFMWCADATNAMTLKYDDEWKKDETFFAGKNFTVNGYSGWCTLSNGEWTYLLETRTGNRFAKAKINGMSGLLIFPDGYSLPSGYSSDGGAGMSKVNDKSAGFPSENIPDDGDNKIWPEMEADGVVFLPAAGYRNGSDGRVSVDDVGNHGYYWSASPRSGSNVSALNFYSGYVFPNSSDTRDRAQSVRLVTEVK